MAATREDIEAFADLLIDEAKAAGLELSLPLAGKMGREMGMDIADIMTARRIVHNHLLVDIGWVAGDGHKLRPT